MNLVQTLPEGPLDIVGDIHGEYDALHDLLRHLGYNHAGQHSDGRQLVFVGDFFDRGPHSPRVFEKVRMLVGSGRAFAVLGNHEINLLRNDPKDGAGWFFESRTQKDQEKYAPFDVASAASRREIMRFLTTLPLALERPDLRVVHAAWLDTSIDAIRGHTTESLGGEFDRWQTAADQLIEQRQLRRQMGEEVLAWGHSLENPQHQPSAMPAHSEFDVIRQMHNPIKVLTSGIECATQAPFYTSGKWRFAERLCWWDEYTGGIPVVIGHYWRRRHPINRLEAGKGDPDLFSNTHPLSWHGRDGNVFCVDFSVGGRWVERKSGRPVGQSYKLAALQWPERRLVFDDGEVHETQAYGPGIAGR